MSILDELKNVMYYISGRGKVIARDRYHLRYIIRKKIKKYGPNCNLNDIDVSRVTEMYEVFRGSKFNGDISRWNVSNVRSMAAMFVDSEFNGDISNWDVSNVEDMSHMFRGSKFNGNISR